MVLDILKKLLTNYLTLTHYSLSRLFKCLGAWGYLALFKTEELYNSNILAIPFEVIKRIDQPENSDFDSKVSTLSEGCSSELHEAATDCIISILWPCEDVQKFWPISLQVANYVISCYHTCWERSISLDELDKSINLARVFTELTESLQDFSKFIRGHRAS